MAALHITDIESAINWWRVRSPSPDGVRACDEVLALAEVYALMVYYREPECDEATMPKAAHDAWLAWYASTPDAPCIAICSTAQGDAVCKGCGRTEHEVQDWPRLAGRVTFVTGSLEDVEIRDTDLVVSSHAAMSS